MYYQIDTQHIILIIYHIHVLYKVCKYIEIDLQITKITYNVKIIW
jgi:hypothetical protein